jgi:shikimate kinase
MKPIFLIGYMGCGKSTLGRALQRLCTGWQFIDLDNYIENRFHATISELFAARGEQGFRSLEHAMLGEVAEFADTIVACGGGTPCFLGNMELMNSRGTTVWLTTPTEHILQRLMRNRSKRPLLAGKTDEELRRFVEENLEARRPFYSQAQAQFCSTALEDKAQIGTTAAEFARQFNIPLQ